MLLPRFIGKCVLGQEGIKEKRVCKIICGAPTTLSVKELMMMIIMNNYVLVTQVVLTLSCSIEFWWATRRDVPVRLRSMADDGRMS